MSIIDKIESITTSRNTIRTKMVTAGQATRTDKLATLANNLSITYTSDATATASDILEGKTAYAEGTKITGTITSKSAQTYTPGTTAQTIASGQYLSGTQTIQGSSALTAANIKQGTSIFGVTGTFTSDATATAEDIAEGKTAYVNGSKLVGTASGGGGLDDSYGVTFADPDGVERSHISTGWIITNKVFNSPVTIGNNVTSCAYMFNGCYSFNQPVTIPNNVISCAYMFNGCYGFSKPVTIPNDVTNCVYMFNGCVNFNQPMTIPNNVDNCGYMFYGCINFNQPVTIGNNVTNCAYMFSGCYKFIQPMTIPNNVDNCAYMFNSCSNFNKPVTIPNNVTNCSYMFNGCSNLNQPVTIGNNVTSCTYMFNGCYNFNQPVTISNNAISCAYMFNGCSNFDQPVTIPNNVTNCYTMFNGCAKFSKNINVYSKVITNIKNMLRGNNSLRKNIFFNSSVNSVFNKTDASSLVGTAVTWTPSTNGFYNATWNVYCYYNLPI